MIKTFSLFAKAAGRNEIHILLAQKDGSFASVWFDLSTGTVGTAVGDAVGLIEKYADGWFRCMFMADSATGGTTPSVIIRLGSGSETQTYDGDGASGVYFWGMQFEVDAAFPSSFNITAASTTARSPDSLQYTLAWLGQTLTEDLDDVTAYMRMARPFHADAVGSLGANSPSFFTMSDSLVRLRLTFLAASRLIETEVDTATTDATKSLAVPSGTVIEVSAQYRDLRTGGATAVDVGSGLSAFVTGATAFSAFGDTTLNAGRFNTADAIYGALFDLKIARGLRTLKQMQESF